MSIPDAALEASIAIIGTTGGGKSYTARGLVERLLWAGRRVCILDPVGVWWGLKSDATGSGPGFNVAVIGGEYGDMPLAEGMGAPLASAIAANNLPIVIDTSEMGVGERNRFLLEFMSELYRANRGALTLVLEEADEIAPQSPMPESRRLLDAVDKIARRGRSRGFRLVMISQRPAVIHKNVLTQIRTMIAHRLTAPQDRKAVEEWIKGHGDSALGAEVIASLPRMATGEAWVWAPELDILERSMMPAITTLDSSRTPSADEEPLAPVGLAEIDLSPLRAALEAHEPDTTRVEKKGAAAELSIEERSKIWNAARAEGYQHGLADGRRSERARWRDILGAIIEAPEPEDAPTPGDPLATSPPTICAIATPRNISTGAALSPSAAKLLAVVAESRKPIHFKTAAKRAGLSLRSSALPAHRRAIVEAGYATETGGVLSVTDDGAAIAGPAPSGLDEWFARLTPGQASMLRVLRENQSPLTLDEISDRAQVSRTSSALGSGLKELCDLGLAVRIQQGVYALAPDMT